MKAILTIIFVILVGSSAMAQTATKEIKVETTTMKVELNIKIEKEDVQENKVARLYRYKNSRVKKALQFQTRKRIAKMA